MNLVRIFLEGVLNHEYRGIIGPSLSCSSCNKHLVSKAYIKDNRLYCSHCWDNMITIEMMKELNKMALEDAEELKKILLF